MEIETSTQFAGAKRLRLTRDERSQHVASWKGSGLSASAYAEAHGLRASNLYTWSGRVGMSKGGPSPFVPVRIRSGETGTVRTTRIVLRSGNLECVIEGAENAEAFASLAGALKRKVFDV